VHILLGVNIYEVTPYSKLQYSKLPLLLFTRNQPRRIKLRKHYRHWCYVNEESRIISSIIKHITIL